MNAQQLTDIEFWMTREFGKRTNDAAWAIYLKRLELGYELPAGLDQNTRFWLNAYPAKCAYILTLQGIAILEPSLALVCADETILNVDSSNENQTESADQARELMKLLSS